MIGRAARRVSEQTNVHGCHCPRKPRTARQCAPAATKWPLPASSSTCSVKLRLTPLLAAFGYFAQCQSDGEPRARGGFAAKVLVITIAKRDVVSDLVGHEANRESKT